MYRPDHGTGYRIALGGFRHPVGYRGYRTEVAAFLWDWFGYEIESVGEEAVIRSAGRAAIAIEALHERIQFDPQAQYSLYQTAMSLWR